MRGDKQNHRCSQPQHDDARGRGTKQKHREEEDRKDDECALHGSRRHHCPRRDQQAEPQHDGEARIIPLLCAALTPWDRPPLADEDHGECDQSAPGHRVIRAHCYQDEKPDNHCLQSPPQSRGHAVEGQRGGVRKKWMRRWELHTSKPNVRSGVDRHLRLSSETKSHRLADVLTCGFFDNGVMFQGMKNSRPRPAAPH